MEEKRLLDLVRSEVQSKVQSTVNSLQRLVIGLLITIMAGTASLAYSAARVVGSVDALHDEVKTLTTELTATTDRSLKNQRLLDVHEERLNRGSGNDD